MCCIEGECRLLLRSCQEHSTGNFKMKSLLKAAEVMDSFQFLPEAIELLEQK